MSKSQSADIVNSAVSYIMAAADVLMASKFSATAIESFRSKVSGQLKRSAGQLVTLGWADGNGDGKPDPSIARRYIDEQLHFLELWIADIGQAQKLVGGAGRAAMYGESLGQTYQRAYILARGSRVGLPELPAYPRDGSTVCLTHCRCEWKIKKLSPVLYEATWKLGIAEHCPNCIERADLWGPLSIIRQQGRGADGVLVQGEWVMTDMRGREVTA